MDINGYIIRNLQYTRCYILAYVFYDKDSKVPEWIQRLLNQIVNLVFWGIIVFSIWLLF